MITLKETFNDISAIDEMQLAKISDKLWEFGTLEEIKENTDADLFYLHIAANMIGNWKGEGWWCVICEHADERRELVKRVRQNVNRLEDLTYPIWGDEAECNGWKAVVDYITRCLQ